MAFSYIGSIKYRSHLCICILDKYLQWLRIALKKSLFSHKEYTIACHKRNGQCITRMVPVGILLVIREMDVLQGKVIKVLKDKQSHSRSRAPLVHTQFQRDSFIWWCATVVHLTWITFSSSIKENTLTVKLLNVSIWHQKVGNHHHQKGMSNFVVFCSSVAWHSIFKETWRTYMC